MIVSLHKHLVIAAYFLVILLFTNMASAKQPAKVAIHINNPLKMTMLVNNVKNMRKVLGPEAKIIVVVNGPAVARFTKMSQSRAQLDSILSDNAEVAICSIALKNKKIAKSSLYKGMNYLENGGAAKLVELQHEGYAYIKP